jgi:hypothetical protein
MELILPLLFNNIKTRIKLFKELEKELAVIADLVLSKISH